MFVHLVLVAGVKSFVLPLHRLDELAVGAVAEKLEHLRKQSLVLVRVALAAVVRHLLHESGEDLTRLVVDGSVHRGQLETIDKVPFQEWGVQQDLLRRHYTQQLLLLWETLAPAVL